MTNRVYHVIVLSNLPRAYNKYKAHYCKQGIPESTYPDRFYVLPLADLYIGIDKATRLLSKLGLAGNRLLVLAGDVPRKSLKPNLRNGSGHYLESTYFPVSEVFFLNSDETLLPTTVEEAMAAALALNGPTMMAYSELAPRSLSVLPVALACQASCRFCFSKTSVSADTVALGPALAKVKYWAVKAKRAGATRFVITGGGEPGLVKHPYLLDLISTGNEFFSKTVLITNGLHLSKRDESLRQEMLRDYAKAGLSVLAISRHFHDDSRNKEIMGIDTGTQAVINTWTQLSTAERPGQLRLICVLQKKGVECEKTLQDYLTWATDLGVPELCFKELYVSTTLESAYHAKPENTWSRKNQVPLSLVTGLLEKFDFKVIHQLPWGAPVYQGLWNGKLIAVAAYTEPSLYWERTTGIARSWNILENGRCLASLEDTQSDLSSKVSPSVSQSPIWLKQNK